MIPLEEREGRGTWVMGCEALVSLVWGVCICECVWILRGCTGWAYGLNLAWARRGAGSGDGQMDHNVNVFFLLSLEYSA